MTDRVVLFVDYQNTYKGAREAFYGQADAHHHGQFNPRRLGELISADSPYERELTEIRVYRGLPSSTFDPKGYGASRKQLAAWEGLGKVTPITRPLRYPDGWPNASEDGQKPGEKGIDVSLAIDFAAMAVRKEFDVGIIFSADTDLRPALEFVAQEAESAGTYYPRAEVAAWRPVKGRRSPRLQIPDRNIYCHMIDFDGYKSVCDPVDYNRRWS